MADTIRLEGLNSVQAMIADLGPGLDRANKNAQNKMAYELMVAERDQAKSSLDRPTPFTVSSIAYKKVGATSFKAGSVTVSVPDVAGAGLFVADMFHNRRADEDAYVGVQIFGGATAGPRASERALQSMGFMPRGTVWVPAAGVGLDAYGNVRGAGIQSMLADLRANGRRGQNFAVMGAPGREKGIITKVGDDWYPWLWFVTPRVYSARLGFYERAEREVAARFPQILADAVDYELQRMSR